MTGRLGAKWIVALACALGACDEEAIAAAVPDAQIADTGSGSGSDTDSGSGSDTDSGAGTNTDADTDTDTGADAGADTSERHGGATPCAEMANYESDGEWPFEVTVTEGAHYCALPDESRTLVEERALKARLFLPAGSFRLPNDGSAEHPITLPFCIERADGSLHVATAGIVTQSHTTGSDQSYHSYRATLPTGDPSRSIVASFQLETGSAGTEPLVLDGGAAPPFSTPSFLFQLVCDVAGCSRSFDSCDFAEAALQTHRVELGEDGTIELELRIGSSPEGTEPGAFVGASGTFRGTAFAQTDYFELVYRPDHHHFSRHFAVFFEAPIDGVCGIELHHLSPYMDFGPEPTAFAIDCDLVQLAELGITSHTFARGE